MWPRLALQPEWVLAQRASRLGERLLFWSYLGLALGHGFIRLQQPPWGSLPQRQPLSGAALLVAGPCVTVRRDEEGSVYVAKIEGRLILRISDDDPFRRRLLILFLRLLEDPEEQRGSRRTRDGRTPFVRQEYLAQAFGIPRPDLSRWERYWQTADWRRLLSQMAKEVLTLEVQQHIIETWAHWPSWGIEQVHRFLIEQGLQVTESQVRQAAQESGWQIVRGVLASLCAQQAETLRLRENWLLGDLLAQVQLLLDKVEAGQGLTPEEHLDVAAWQQAAQEAGLAARVSAEAEPCLRTLHTWLLGRQEVTVEARCPDCGGTHVGRKGLKPRHKKFVDAQGQVQEVEVYRYRCHNPACRRESFTVFPPGLVPYSLQRLEVHVLALQMYAWGRSTYRLTGKALGIATTTTYRWVSAFGYQLLPMAALFGVVWSSGVVGVDEKWVQVPKNNKRAGPHRKWMYVYLAVDVYTYDLLHIDLYAYNTAESAQAFLLALRAKGYHPRVVVTDLRRDYGPAIAQIFPRAEHHECLFHASQALHRQLADIRGWDALKTDAQLMALRQALDAPLQARTKRTAQKHYDELMAQRDAYEAASPALATVFASLEAHWPKLINGIESDLIPRTNNTVELVIRRFDQHYQNFCGFDSLETAQRFLAVFEKVYRFTPFSEDAQPKLRGRSPLEIAGYDLGKVPFAEICSGYALTIQSAQAGVPSE